MGTESWFTNPWWNSRKEASETDKAVIGALTFEVASLMSKIVKLWHFLDDKKIVKLRKNLLNSIGILRLVSDDDYYVMDLALNEIMENFGILSGSVARLGRRCMDTRFRRFEHFVDDPLANNFEWFGWEYRLTKMERKVKKMERFVGITMELSRELEVLAEVEKTREQMRANPDQSPQKMSEIQQKVILQRQEVRNLRQMSPWIRTYDYVVRLLVRSLLTILQKIINVFQTSQLPSPAENIDQEYMNPACLPWNHSFNLFMPSSVHPSENFLCGISSGPVCRLDSKSGTSSAKNKVNNRQRQFHLSSAQLAQTGPFRKCTTSGSKSPVREAGKPALCVDYTQITSKTESLDIKSLICSNRIYSKLALFSTKCGLLNAPTFTLGYAALALHYANLIVFIEQLAYSSPSKIDDETRDHLYSMLPTSIRVALRKRLKACVKSVGKSDYDASLAKKWSLGLANMLEWLSPLAHNMIKWHSERNFERDQVISRTNVLLVQTLHYANHAKTEAVIVEMLVLLNYIYRINQDSIRNRSQRLQDAESITVVNVKGEDKMLTGLGNLKTSDSSDMIIQAFAFGRF